MNTIINASILIELVKKCLINAEINQHRMKG